MIHVLPINDTREHEEGTICWCEPCVEFRHPETGVAYTEPLVIHNAADCRDVVEDAERILSNADSEALT